MIANTLHSSGGARENKEEREKKKEGRGVNFQKKKSKKKKSYPRKKSCGGSKIRLHSHLHKARQIVQKMRMCIASESLPKIRSI